MLRHWAHSSLSLCFHSSSVMPETWSHSWETSKTPSNENIPAITAPVCPASRTCSRTPWWVLPWWEFLLLRNRVNGVSCCHNLYPWELWGDECGSPPSCPVSAVIASVSVLWRSCWWDSFGELRSKVLVTAPWCPCFLCIILVLLSSLEPRLMLKRLSGIVGVYSVKHTQRSEPVFSPDCFLLVMMRY